MKKISLSSMDQYLSRSEMRTIKGGYARLAFEGDDVYCKSDPTCGYGCTKWNGGSWDCSSCCI